MIKKNEQNKNENDSLPVHSPKRHMLFANKTTIAHRILEFTSTDNPRYHLIFGYALLIFRWARMTVEICLNSSDIPLLAHMKHWFSFLKVLNGSMTYSLGLLSGFGLDLPDKHSKWLIEGHSNKWLLTFWFFLLLSVIMFGMFLICIGSCFVSTTRVWELVSPKVLQIKEVYSVLRIRFHNRTSDIKNVLLIATVVCFGLLKFLETFRFNKRKPRKNSLAPSFKWACQEKSRETCISCT